jgi:hypothetical protein
VHLLKKLPFVVAALRRLAFHVTQRIPYSRVLGDLPDTNLPYAVFNRTNGYAYARAGLWLFKHMSAFTPFRNPIANDLVRADLMDTTENLAYIIKIKDRLATLFPEIMAVGAFARVDNIANEAVVRGLIAQRPGYRFANHDLFENVQSSSSDGNPTTTDESAYYMLHMAYDHAVLHGNGITRSAAPPPPPPPPRFSQLRRLPHLVTDSALL